jgi:hypothetical protein
MRNIRGGGGGRGLCTRLQAAVEMNKIFLDYNNHNIKKRERESGNHKRSCKANKLC